MKYNFLVIVPLMMLTGCATIMHGARQTVGISSSPTNANVFVDSRPMGRTPVNVELKRRDNHIVRIELDGYKPYEVAITRQLSGWVFGNVVFGGLIGLAIDAITGGIYRLSHEQVQAELRSNKVAYSKQTDESYIAVVLQPKSDWEKIGQLEPILQ